MGGFIVGFVGILVGTYSAVQARKAADASEDSALTADSALKLANSAHELARSAHELTKELAGVHDRPSIVFNVQEEDGVWNLMLHNVGGADAAKINVMYRKLRVSGPTTGVRSSGPLRFHQDPAGTPGGSYDTFSVGSTEKFLVDKSALLAKTEDPLKTALAVLVTYFRQGDKAWNKDFTVLFFKDHRLVLPSEADGPGYGCLRDAIQAEESADRLFDGLDWTWSSNRLTPSSQPPSVALEPAPASPK